MKNSYEDTISLVIYCEGNGKRGECELNVQ